MKEESHITHKWYKILLFCFFLILSIFLYARYIGTTKITVKEIVVNKTNLPNAFYGYKVVQLSDIHYKTTIGRKEFEEVVKKVNKYKPDIVVISGDLLDSNMNYTDNDINNIINNLNDIKCKHKYIITGEDDNSDTFKNILEKIDYKLLDNTYETLYNEDYEPITIAGLSTSSEGQSSKDKLASIEEAIDKNESKFNILVIHEPAIVEEINKEYYSLIMAGHTHNGQINIPIIKDFFMPDRANASYKDLHYEYDNTDLYISPGLGTTGMKARLFNRPTINLYRLTK